MKNTAAAKKYLREGLSKSDYYSGGEQISGTWKGESAKLLGLSGQVVDSKVFDLLCDNLHPSNQTQLTSRNRDDRKPFYDFTFSAPKSVSILWATTSDPKLRMEIEQAMRSAVQSTMQLGENELTLSRDQRNGQTIYNQTGNILFTEFLHDTTRPVGGQPDPHLHVHVAVFNLTFDQSVGSSDGTDSVEIEKGAFRSLEFHDFAKFRSYLEAIHHSKLANLLQQQVGLDLYNTHKSFEIKNFTRDVIDNFSNRTLQVEQYAAANDINSAKAKANIASITREHKGEGQTIEQLRAGWRQRFDEPTKKLVDKVNVSPFLLGKGLGRLAIYENSAAALASAIDHHFENSTVINQRDLISSALNSDLVGTSHESMTQGLKSMKGINGIGNHLNSKSNPKSNSVLSGTQLIATTRSNKGKQETVLTTPQIISEEQILIELIKASKNNSPGLDTAYQLPVSMSLDQDKVLYQVLQSKDSVFYIKGDAGAGKTYLLQNLKLALEAGSVGETIGKNIGNLGQDQTKPKRTIHAFAPTSIAGRKILREEVTQLADTVAKLLIDSKIQNTLNPNSIVFIDEAGMIGYQSMIQLLELQRQKGFSLILVGDTKQHSSIPRGDALRFLEQKADLTPFTLTDNRRQKDNPMYKAAVDQLASRDIAGAFETLDQMGAVKEIEQSTTRYNTIAKDYITLVKDSKNWSQARKDILIVTPTHEEASIITGKIRSELKKAGVIGEREKVTRDKDQNTNQLSNQLKPDIAYPALQDLKLTTAQKTLPNSYHKGQVLQFNQNVKGGYLIGSQWQVKLDKVSGQSVLTQLDPIKDVLNHKTKSLPIPYTDSQSFSVFEPRELKLTPGDLIRVTANATNDQGKKLLNGSSYTIKSINVDPQTKQTQITLDNDWTLPKDFGHLAHGYTSTSYASQGRTVKHLIISQSEMSLPASSFQQGYVSASRGKESISWYTDDKEGLKKALGVMKQREFGVDVIGKAKQSEAKKAHGIALKSPSSVNSPAKIRVKELEIGL
jgi:conjugative relaxase-like TrwC/TraI family protein